MIGETGANLLNDKQKVNNKNILFAIYEEIVYFKMVFAVGPAYRNVCWSIKNTMPVVSGLSSKG